MTVVDTLGAAGCTYELDEERRIVAVDAAWTLFAVSNGAPQLVPPAPIGRSIFEYISDGTTAFLYQRIFDRVEQAHEPVTLPLRCDSPTMRRWIEIEVKPRALSGLTLRSRLLREQARPEMPLIVPQPSGHDDLLRMCSWCKRVAVRERWCEAEEAIAELRLFERARLPGLTHGMCPRCYERINEILER